MLDMRAGKVIKLSLAAVVAAFLLAAGLLYVQISRIPANYRPVRLTAAQKDQTAKDFWNSVLDFANAAQKNESFEWPVSQLELNRYLAAMDEIAAKPPSGKHGRVYRALEEARLAEPTVSLHNGILTLMVRSKEHNKVLSADVSFSFTGDKTLCVRLVGVRVGRLTLPISWGQSQLEEIKRLVPMKNRLKGNDSERLDGREPSGLSSQDLALVLEAILAGIDEEPISTELTWPVNKKRVQIEGIEISDGALRLHATPIGRKRSGD